MSLQLLTSFIGASILLILMPGPDNIFVLTESITKGKRTGIAITLGLASGVLIHTIAAATGLSLFLKNSVYAFAIIKYMGAAYLIYLAIMAFKERNVRLDVVSVKGVNGMSFFRLVRKGFFMNILNPKVTLFFLAFLPQFVSMDGFSVTYQLLILGALFMLLTIIFFSMIALFAGMLTRYVQHKRFWKIASWSKTGVLSLLAVYLLFTKR